MASGLETPTKELVVQIALLGGTRNQVGLFLAAHEQGLLDLLEDEQPFMPAFAGEERSWSILNKRAVVWVAIALRNGRLPIEETDEDASEEVTLYDRRVDVEVQFVRADALHGEILHSPPPAKARLTDYLNQDTRFFRVWTSDSLYLVNKEHVLRLVETEQKN
jgi:hypothetical protein